MTKKVKELTNDVVIKNLIKEILAAHPFYQMIFIERLNKIAELTRKGVLENSEAYYNPIFSWTWYIEFCNIIDKHIKLNTSDK